MGTHAISASKRKRFAGLFQAAGMILVTAVIVVIISNSTPGQTYALMTSSVTVEAGTLSSGTAALTIQGQKDHIFTEVAYNQLLPGRSQVTAQPLTLKNTGTTPLLVTLGTPTFSSGANAFTSKLQFAVKQAASCTLSADNSTFPASATISIASGASLPICVEVGLKTDAPSTVQGERATFTLPFNAMQVRP